MSRFDGYMPGDDTFLLDGSPLSAWGCFLGAGGVTVGEATPRLIRTTVPGRDGVIDQTLRDRQGRAYDDKGRTIEVDVVLTAGEQDQQAMREALAGLHGMRTSMWWRRMWAGEYRGTLRVGEWDDVFTPGMRYLCSSTTLTLECDDSAQHASTERVSLSTGTNLVTVKGNRPVPPTLTLTPPNTVTQIVVDDGANRLTLRPTVPFTGGQSIVINSGRGVTLVNGNPLAPTLDSDYPLLTPPMTRIGVIGASGRLDYEPLHVI